MAKKVKKGGKKEKKKISKDKEKKISENKKEDLEKEIIKIEEKQESDFLETDEEPVTNLEISLTNVKAPVLDQIAISETVNPRFFATFSENPNNQEDSEFTYKTGQAYFQSRENSTGREENGFHYSERPSGYEEASATQDEDKIEETRRLLTGGDMSQIRETNKFEERQTLIEQDRETKKYIRKGEDYK